MSNGKLLIQSKLRQTFARISWVRKTVVHSELRIASRYPLGVVRLTTGCDRPQHAAAAPHVRLIDSCFERLS
jgi:hypothetical protein